MQNITLSSAIKWILGGFAQNWVIWIIALIFGIAIAAIAFGALWIFDKHNAMNPKKRKYFFIGISLLSALFIGTAAIICGVLTSVTNHFDQQTEDMRTAAIGRENRGIQAGILNISKIVILSNTNGTDFSQATSQGIPNSLENRTIETGADLGVIIRVSNAGEPTTLWDYKCIIILPGQNGRQIDAMIPSVIMSNQVIPTIVGPIKMTKENFLLDALSSNPLPTGAAGCYWLDIHVNGLHEVPLESHIIISFHDVIGRETKIDYILSAN